MRPGVRAGGNGCALLCPQEEEEEEELVVSRGVGWRAGEHAASSGCGPRLPSGL